MNSHNIYYVIAESIQQYFWPAWSDNHSYNCNITVLPAKSDSDVMFRLQSNQVL